jgi:hypothetical protein
MVEFMKQNPTQRRQRQSSRKAYADGLCLPPCTDSQARFAVAASKKINALYNADDLEGLYKLIIAIRQAHGAIVDPLIVWA